MNINWDIQIETGIREIDEQHKYLATLIAGYIEDAKNEQDKFAISKKIDKLYVYAINHFKTEESYMNYMTYPEYYRQVKAHIACLEHIMECKKKIIDKNECSFKNFLQFAVDWFKTHTCELDSTLRSHFVKESIIEDK